MPAYGHPERTYCNVHATHRKTSPASEQTETKTIDVQVVLARVVECHIFVRRVTIQYVSYYNLSFSGILDKNNTRFALGRTIHSSQVLAGACIGLNDRSAEQGITAILAEVSTRHLPSPGTVYTCDTSKAIQLCNLINASTFPETYWLGAELSAHRPHILGPPESDIANSRSSICTTSLSYSTMVGRISGCYPADLFGAVRDSTARAQQC